MGEREVSPIPGLVRGFETQGRGMGSVWRITQWLHTHAGPFVVSAFISTTEIQLREFGLASFNDGVLSERPGQALRQTGSAEDWR